MTFTCPTCQFDRTLLPSGARFCPRCGGALPDDISMVLDRHGVPAVDPMAPPGHYEKRSEILTGFANALYRLGWRYETGVGAWRNEAEAFRCYGKSAKMGNEAAAARVRDVKGEP